MMNHLKKLLIALFVGLTVLPTQAQELSFTALPSQWDEGIPLGNGIMGTLIWQKEGKLRLSLDRADLWDLRPVKEFEGHLVRLKLFHLF